LGNLVPAGVSTLDRSVGDAYDNALAETTIGHYKHECVRADSPFRPGLLDRLSDLEMITTDWVHWYNTGRLTHHLGRITPVEAEANYDAQTRDDQTAVHTYPGVQRTRDGSAITSDGMQRRSCADGDLAGTVYNVVES
jgi:hypothetical protein